MRDGVSKRGRGEAPGLKVLISAGALAATLSGWAILGSKDAQPVSGSNAPTGGAAMSPDLPTLMQPLPTVVPPPGDIGTALPAGSPTPMRRILRSVSLPPPAPAEPDAVTRSSR